MPEDLLRGAGVLPSSLEEEIVLAGELDAQREGIRNVPHDEDLDLDGLEGSHLTISRFPAESGRISSVMMRRA
jgi:hypothetical protein